MHQGLNTQIKLPNRNQDSVTALPVSCLQCFQKWIVVVCLAEEVFCDQAAISYLLENLLDLQRYITFWCSD